MKKLLLGLLAGFFLVLPAGAQVNTVPQTGLVTNYLLKPTFSATAVALAPAASATDIFCISGSANKKIGVQQITVSGTAGTLITAPVVLVRRASLDTGGTPATGTALPVASRHDSNMPAATATLVSYTANPTINDSSPLYFGARWVTFPTTAAGTTVSPAIFSFNISSELVQPLYLQGVAQQACLNLNATSVSSGSLNVYVQWTEE